MFVFRVEPYDLLICIIFIGHYMGRRTSWMDASGKEVTLWQQMLDRPNFWVEGSLHLRPAEKIVVEKGNTSSQSSLSSSPSSKSYHPV